MDDVVKLLLRIVLIMMIPLLVAAITFFYMQSLFFEPVNPSDPKKILVEAAADKSFKDFCKELVKEGLVKHWRVIDLLARFQGSPEIKAGEYELSPNMKPKEILQKLVSGQVFKRKLVLKSGTSVWEIGRLLHEAALMSEAEFTSAVDDAKLLAAAGVRASTFEGYLFPGEYQFSKADSVRMIIWTMMEQAETNWKPEYTERADELGMNRHDVLTLASIIEKEARKKEEMPAISSVLHNRLDQGMKLRSNATVIYGLKKFKGTLTEKDLQDPHSYNTFVNYNFPPGPICNPSVDAIQAALEPKKTSYLFFVARKDGGHEFCKNQAEYDGAIRKHGRFN